MHAIIVGGSTLKETLNDLYELARQLPPEVDIVVWLNEHFGLIKQGDKSFTDMEVFNRTAIASAASCSLVNVAVDGAVRKAVAEVFVSAPRSRRRAVPQACAR